MARRAKTAPKTLVRKPLAELAAIIRSKNAGPFRLTFDILFDDPAIFRAVVGSGAITKESVARLYGVPVRQVSSLFVFDKANAIKITLVRPLAQCAIGESDVYGAQQHVPLMGISIPLGGNY